MLKLATCRGTEMHDVCDTRISSLDSNTIGLSPRLCEVTRERDHSAKDFSIVAHRSVPDNDPAFSVPEAYGLVCHILHSRCR